MQPPAWITQLADNEAVAYSQIRPKDKVLLEQIQALRLVEIATQGNQRRVVIINKEGFSQWFRTKYPETALAPVTGQRAANIARAGHSKAGVATHKAQPILLRWFSTDPNSTWADLTRRCGIIGITSDRLATLDLPPYWTLLTIENWEPFLAVDYAPQTGAIITIFTGGNIAETTLQALATLRPTPTQAIHFGDYDWSGLAIYRRIRATIPQCLLYIPTDIALLFRNFASHDLLIGQSPLVVREDDPPEFHEVTMLIAQYNAGLEQEIIAPPVL
ncbi:Wadjet anti-phage system protein JetD domain-containing protein [Candidatus Oscillochloris fontis]|uniref:Wadjet anti-phage system protein JetD domain-containing protein n=1 Tax=Candidatus Oscillochloris fontis TaxID=2496868 RepID=UPI00101DB94A|nr:Wadjet anti-phage system protein JetD domain-containing protein [Candidatus Oscillochloris fontis]